MARQKSEIDALLAEVSALKDRLAEIASSGVSEAGEAMCSAASDAGSAAGEATDHIFEMLRDCVRDHPLTSVGSAFALGMTVARMLRR